MKTVCEKWLAAHAIAACLSCFAFSPIARAGSSDGQVIRGNPAASVLAATVESGGAEQLARGNAAYARGDYAEAFRLYRNIGVLGISEAHYRLGLMYLDGVGTRKSIRQAEYWLKLAASENHPGAAAALSSLRAIRENG